ncbi:hypothetical protein [Croceicoccus naphthovorans]|uniref:Uncharacterized protein n=1 Tax=Croceicoccus naphthovorans TaxID=1348774 RepID=A0A0G3XIY5_9SPHN|nr:hypothetical protein [Croceicoccus naphthovorans]AKM11152.1 hypothetical protein AB433_16110 [Croceicoccus naphthovorans]MBB3989970.1 hypothetical protein [Croceicoccus naphthovorans]
METPREAIDDTLRHIADRLADCGFAVRSGHKLARKRGDMTEELHAQADRGNRAGEVVRFRLSAMTHSAAAKRWTMVQTEPALHSEGPFAGVVGSTQLHFAEGLNGRDFDVVNPDDRPFVAETFAARVLQTVLPWFDTLDDPEAALATMGDVPTNETWLLRFALAHGLDAEARDALARRCGRYPDFAREFAQYVAQIAANGPPQGYRDATEELAAFAVAANLAP